jgi:hypothetical protein
MSGYDDLPTSVTVNRSSGSGFYFIVGALLAVILVGDYLMLGMPGLDPQVAKAPATQKIDVTVQQPAAPAIPGRR